MYPKIVFTGEMAPVFVQRTGRPVPPPISGRKRDWRISFPPLLSNWKYLSCRI